MVTINDVSALAGVSRGAVSRVLSGDPSLRVSDDTRERVLAAAHELAYVPNHAARALRTSRSRSLALVVPDVTSAVFAELARGAEEQAGIRDLTIVLARAEQLAVDSTWLQRMVGEGRIDGVILQVPDDAPDQAIEAVVDRVPVILINSVEDGAVSSLVLDDAAGIRIALEHLQSLGHVTVGFVGGAPGSGTARRRLDGFVAGVDALSLTTRSEWISHLGYSGGDGRLAVDALLAAGALPTALVVANLNAALGVLAELHARELRVPDDISIVALHDVWYADATWPPMTTVKMPLRELGSEAVSMLIDRDSVDEVERRVIREPAPQLIVRASTAEPAANRPS
ncbi:LacI family DNA-binding transcriptional regulator [soil metagenome]